MANVIHRTTLQFVPSVNTPDYPEPTWKHNPVMTAVAAVPQKYWKAPADWNAVGAGPVEMTTGEKATVDAAIAAAAASALVTNFDQTAPPGVFRSIIKSATTTRTATTVLADDPHLTFPVLANAKYRFWFSVFFDTSAAGDFKIALAGPASPAAVRFFRYTVAAGATSLSNIGVSTSLGGAGLAVAGTGTTGGYATGYGILSNGANAGNVTVQWAQNTSDVGNTSVLEGSMLYYARIG